MASARSRTAGLRHAEDFAAEILDDPNYKQELKSRAKRGDLAPQVEVALMHYRWGKPIERLEVSTDEDLTTASKEDLLKIAAELQAYVRGLPDDDVEPNVADMPSVSDQVQ